jgi:hypothetical protein
MSQLAPAGRIWGEKMGHVWPGSSPHENWSGMRTADVWTSTSVDPVFVIVDPLTVNVPTAFVPKFTRFGLALRRPVASAVTAGAIPAATTRAVTNTSTTFTRSPFCAAVTPCGRAYDAFRGSSTGPPPSDDPRKIATKEPRPRRSRPGGEATSGAKPPKEKLSGVVDEAIDSAAAAGKLETGALALIGLARELDAELRAWHADVEQARELPFVGWLLDLTRHSIRGAGYAK